MKFEKIELSGHARKRMRQRNIPRRQIMRTLNEPERVDESGDKMVAERATEVGNVIRVVYIEKPEGSPGVDAFIVSLVRRSGNVE